MSGTSDEAAVEVVLLANDGVLPLAPDRTIAVITAQPVTGAGPTLADELAVGDVVDLGPALSAELGTPPPVPAEFLTTPDGHAGLITELFAQPDFTEPLGQERVAGIVRGTDTDLDDAAAVRWTGRLTAPADGRYTLSLAATGHSSLTVDGAEAPAQPTTTAGNAAIVRSEPVELDLAAGEAVEIEVEQSDSDPHAQAVLGWQAPGELAPEAITGAVAAAAAADTVVIHVPAVVGLPDGVDDRSAGVGEEQEAAEGEQGVAEASEQQGVAEAGEEQDAAEPDEEHGAAEVGAAPGDARVPGALPVDHTQLIQQVVEANPRTIVVLDATADPSLFSWLDEVAAVVHVPAAGADSRLLADVLDGTCSPSGVLSEPLLPKDSDDAPHGDTDDVPGFPVGFGLTYETTDPTDAPNGVPTNEPATVGPTGEPTVAPSGEPIGEPTTEPTNELTTRPTTEPTPEPADTATGEPTAPEQVRGEPGRTQPRGERPPRSRSGTIAITGRVPGHTPGLYLSVSTDAAALGDAEFLADRWQLRGTLPAVTVVDTRDDQETGWTVSARMSNLTGPAQVLPAGSVGWTPSLIDVAEGVTAGPAVATRLSGGPGLAESAVLGRAVGAAPPGRTQLGADLVLETGYDTAPGRYAGSLTVTIFPTEAD